MEENELAMNKNRSLKAEMAIKHVKSFSNLLKMEGIKGQQSARLILLFALANTKASVTTSLRYFVYPPYRHTKTTEEIDRRNKRPQA